ncbi:single-stranded DNA-binding protein [Lactobacillus sp. ESL0228]|nr:single-stranded DNA-binding protein [Lactobacillus sp. ESL0228]
MVNKVTLTGFLASDAEKMFEDGCWYYTRMAVGCDDVWWD